MRASSERGAVLIHVAVALLVMVAFTTFVADYGALWVSRNHAQNSADAGALAGAVGLAYDNFTNRTATGPAKLSARSVALANDVFGEDPAVDINTDVTFVNCPGAASPPPIAQTPCIRVDVHRTTARGNPLPTWFGNLLGIGSQGVRAMAIAKGGGANTTSCLRPWAVADRWLEGDGTYSDDNDTFDPAQGDTYMPPIPGPGTGYSADNIGEVFILKTGPPGQGGSQISPGWFQALDLLRDPPTGSGGNNYRDNIETCGNVPSAYAREDTVCPTSISDRAYWQARGCFIAENGNMNGPTTQGVDFLIDQDPNAHWDPDDRAIAESDYPPGQSPRIVPVGVMDIGAYLAGGSSTIKLVNIFGFFIESTNGHFVYGRLVAMPGEFSTLGGDAGPAAFLRQITLVR